MSPRRPISGTLIIYASNSIDTHPECTFNTHTNIYLCTSKVHKQMTLETKPEYVQASNTALTTKSERA
jgi:hypothetical protein